MKILFISIVDIKHSAPQRIHHFLRHLSHKHDVTVICINDINKKDKLSNDFKFGDSYNFFQNIKIIYITEKKINPIIQEMLAPLFLRGLDLSSYDLIFNYNSLLSGLYISRRTKVPVIFDIADDLPAMIEHSAYVARPLKPLGSYIGWQLMKKNIRHAKFITSTTRAFIDKFEIPEEKFIYLPNGVFTSLFKKIPSNFKTEQGLINHFILGYVGVLREWVDLDPVFRCLKAISNTCLLIVGEEGNLQDTTKKIKDLGITDRVIFTGNVAHHQLPYLIQSMDVCLIPFRKNDISESAIPLKLFEYLACEKPVISSRIEGVIQTVGNRIFYADTPSEYTEIIEKLINGSQTSEISTEIRDYIQENFDWDVLFEKLDHVIDRVK